jgi:hypothetical protein
MEDDDDYEDFSNNPLEDEEAIQEKKFLYECMNALNDVKKTKETKHKEEDE